MLRLAMSDVGEEEAVAVQAQHAGGPRIGIYVSFSGAGGVERMVANLAAGMARRGVRVDLLLARARSEHLGAFPEGVRVLKLPSDHTYGNLLALRRYLVRDAPAALLAVKHRAIQTAVAARWLSGRHVPLAGRLGTHVSAALEGRGRVRRALWRLGIRAFYPAVDRLICVSEGVAQDGLGPV
jgi:hypothetical protein